MPISKSELSFSTPDQKYTFSADEIQQFAVQMYDKTDTPNALIALQFAQEYPHAEIQYFIAVFGALESGKLQRTEQGTLPKISIT